MIAVFLEAAGKIEEWRGLIALSHVVFAVGVKMCAAWCAAIRVIRKITAVMGNDEEEEHSVSSDV